MSTARVQCSLCQYETVASSAPCPRCGASLASAYALSDSKTTGSLYSPVAASPTYRARGPQAAGIRGVLHTRARMVVAACLALAVGAAGVFLVMKRREARESHEKLVKILTEQPDFVATVDGVEGGDVWRGRHARFGDREMIEMPRPKSLLMGTGASGMTQASVIFDSTDTVQVVSHEFWMCVNLSKSSMSADAGNPFEAVRNAAARGTATIVEKGHERVGEYDTIVLHVTISDAEAARINVAPALKNLIVRFETLSGVAGIGTPMTYTWSNVSLKSDPSLFDVPSSYRTFTVSNGKITGG